MNPKLMEPLANDESNQPPVLERPRIGRYVVDRLLDRGGMAEVFVGKALGPAGFSKRVVIKRILPHLAEDESFVTMFLNEARLVALLEHPNIAQVFDFGQHSETYYIAMEYVEGESLRTILKYYKALHQQMPLTPALAWVQNVCEGLAYAHDLKDEIGKNQNIVHRDVSPENILISKAGTAKVVDFGIAKAALNPQVTAAGEVRGKLSYIAPEQISGAKIDRRADVYSLGVTLYEALVGERPHSGTNPLELLYSILNAEPQAIHKVRPDVDAGLSAIVSRAIARDPNQRYPDMQALYSEIDDYRNSHSLRVKSSELADVVALVEAWDPRTKGGISSNNSLGSLRSSNSNLIPHPTGKPPGASREKPALPSVARPPPQDSAKPPENPGEMPPPLAVAAPVSGPVPWDGAKSPSRSSERLPSATLKPLAREAPKPAAAPASESAPRRRGPIVLWASLGAAAAAIVAVVALSQAGRRTHAPRAAPPTPVPDIAEPTPQAARARKISVPPISLLPEKPETPPAPVSAPAAVASPAQAPKQRPAPKPAPLVAVKPSPPRPATAARPTPHSRPTQAELPEPPSSQESKPPEAAAVQTPSAPPTVDGEGWLNLRTEPWCEVYYRGELIGTTPINRLVFPAGKHSLRLVNKAMGIERDTAIEIRPGEESTARLNLGGG